MQTIDIQKKLVHQLIPLFPEDTATLFDSISTDEVLSYLKELDATVAGEVLQNLNPHVVGNVLEAMDDQLFVNLLAPMQSYACTLLISRVKPTFVEDKLRLLPEKKSREIREMLTYPYATAGSLMDTSILSFNPENKVEDVLQRLRTLGDVRISVIFVSDKKGKLVGRVPIQMIAISQPEKMLKDLLEPCVSIHVMSPKEEVVEIFEKGKIINLPVVDGSKKLLGIIRSDTLIAATQQDATQDVLTMFGAGREEQALSPPLFAVRKRLPWLQINLATAFLAAAIVGIFEDTIARVTVLAVFLPVVAGQSGNTGSQALAVTMRGLALREIHTSQWWKVARKEVTVGFVNGIAVALTTSLIAYFWSSSFGIALVIASSMVLSMVIAGFSGAVVPIVLKAAGQDPAQSSSIVLTTVTDIMGFLSFLGLATMLGSALGIF